MTKFKFSQFGTFSVAIILPILFLCIYLAYKIPSQAVGEAFPLIAVAIVIFFSLLTFYRITILVDDTFVTFSLGIGLIKKSYRLTDIKSCYPVRNFPLTGFGIRKIPNGWLYNVSGLDAVELSFYNRNSVVRIGTNKPYEVAEVINGLLGNDLHGSQTFEKAGNNRYRYYALFLLIMLIPAFLLFYGSREMKTQISGTELVIKGMYGMKVKYADIVSLDTLKSIPEIRLRTNGFADARNLRGNFLLKDGRKVKLFINKDNPPYILISSKEAIIFLNLNDRRTTSEFYSQLKTVVAASK